MRWQVILTVALCLSAIGLEHRPVLGQLLHGIARRCGGCGVCNTCRPRLRPRLIPRLRCRRCPPNNCACPPIVPPAPQPVMCPTYTTRMVPRRVTSWEMCPQTVCRQQAYCETVPVTTYRKVVITVPQTEYRSVMRTRPVAEQIMVPRRRVDTVWEPRLQRTFRPVCPPVCAQPMPVCTDGCGDMFGGGQMFPGQPLPGGMLPGQPTFNNGIPSQPMLTVPNAPNMNNSQENLRVPTPSADPNFTMPKTDNSQTYYSPWQTVQPRNGYPEPLVQDNGYRTLGQAPQIANGIPKFVPAPSATTVWQYQR